MNLFELLILSAVAVFLVFLAFRSWFEASCVRSIEKDLPAALFSMASYEPGASLDSVLSEVANCSLEPLKSVLNDCVRQVRAGVPFCVALRRMGRRYASPLLARVVLLLDSAYQSGADLSDVFRKVAQDAHEFHRLQSLRRDSFAVQKYTLYAGAVIVPALLGLLFSWMPPSSGLSYRSAVFWGLQIYLAAFSFLSVAFIAVVESDFRAFVRRSVFLSVFVLWVFHAVRISTA